MRYALPVEARNEPTFHRLTRFPSSRYMGSKHAILPFIHQHLRPLRFSTALDAFSGSASVGYLLKAMGKAVTSNDFLNFSYHMANASVANSHIRLPPDVADCILMPHPDPNDFIETTFRDIYFTEQENRFLDHATAHIRDLIDPYQQSIAFTALVRACLRRRPRGIFTYTGVRYMDGRRDLRIPMEQQFSEAVLLLNESVFDNGQNCSALHGDVFDLPDDSHYDLVYFDPPYVSRLSDNDYTRRYHFVEGLTRYWEGLPVQGHTMTRKFQRIPSAFDSQRTIHDAFRRLFARHQDSIIVVSYSSNSIPSKDEMAQLLREFKPRVTVYECDHLYSFGTHGHKVGGNQNAVKEYLFIGR